MSRADRTPLAPGSPPERATVAALAQLVLHDTAPHELAIFDEVADEYFHDPAAVLTAPSRDEAVGFGLDLALLTPYLLAIMTSVVSFVSALVADAVKDEATPVVARFVRRLFRGEEDGSDTESEPAPLDAGQAAHVREIAYDRATALGLVDSQAQLLADAIVGRLRVAP